MRRSVPLWCWWIAVVWLISFSWVGLTYQPQWDRVHWIPFEDPADKLRDVVANILLYVPFGYSFGKGHRRATIVRAAAAAALIATAAEALQLFSTVRFPSVTDVCSAVIGAVAGAAATFRPGAPSNLKRPPSGEHSDG